MQTLKSKSRRITTIQQAIPHQQTLQVLNYGSCKKLQNIATMADLHYAQCSIQRKGEEFKRTCKTIQVLYQSFTLSQDSTHRNYRNREGPYKHDNNGGHSRKSKYAYCKSEHNRFKLEGKHEKEGRRLTWSRKIGWRNCWEDTPRISEHERRKLEDGSLRKKLAENWRRRVKVKSKNSKNPFLNHVDYVD